MNNSSLAPCGVICDLCAGFQRKKDKCTGCLNPGYKPYHCTVCSIKFCAEKKGNPELLCYVCAKFPCRRLKDLDKRYISKYGESLVQNLNEIKETGMQPFIDVEKEKWTCKHCGQLLCVHREVCLHCGTINAFFPPMKV